MYKSKSSAERAYAAYKALEKVKVNTKARAKAAAQMLRKGK